MTENESLKNEIGEIIEQLRTVRDMEQVGLSGCFIDEAIERLIAAKEEINEILSNPD